MLGPGTLQGSINPVCAAGNNCQEAYVILANVTSSACPAGELWEKLRYKYREEEAEVHRLHVCFFMGLR